MKVEIKGNKVICTRETGERIPNVGEQSYARDRDGMLLYRLKKILNTMGFDLIKKRMCRDGHMTDEFQQYLRAKNKKSNSPHIFIHDPDWAIRSAAEEFNKNKTVSFAISFDVFEVQPNCTELMKQFGTN